VDPSLLSPVILCRVFHSDSPARKTRANISRIMAAMDRLAARSAVNAALWRWRRRLQSDRA